MLALFEKEYDRLRNLVDGMPLYGDCELVALMISRILPNSTIVRGTVFMDLEELEIEEIDHCWVRDKEDDIDPLSDDRMVTEVVKPTQIINDSDLHLPEPLRQIEHEWNYEENGNPFLF